MSETRASGGHRDPSANHSRQIPTRPNRRINNEQERQLEGDRQRIIETLKKGVHNKLNRSGLSSSQLIILRPRVSPLPSSSPDSFNYLSNPRVSIPPFCPSCCVLPCPPHFTVFVVSVYLPLKHPYSRSSWVFFVLHSSLLHSPFLIYPL